LNRKRWNILPAVPDGHYLTTTGKTPLVNQLLYNRGLTDPEQVTRFIDADKRLTADPFLLPDMHKAVARIYRALLSGETIAIYGDFDADGITATALLVQGLTALQGKVVPYIPHRLYEGHGLRVAALEKLHQQGVSLVISVDCGITGYNEVKKARKMGLDIVITDHHAPPEDIPEADAVVDPKLPSSQYPFTELAGVGVAYKLLQALLQSLGKEEQIEKLMDLVALGTVADMVPLLSENRYLVKEGLRVLNTYTRIGINEMLTQAGLKAGNLVSDNISWVLAPRLNTASRMEHALPSYELLTTESPDMARNLSKWLEHKNTERQRITEKATSEARKQVLAEGLTPLLMVGGPDYQAGIAGLVAGRLSEEFYRPSVVVRTGKRISTGSCRSIPEFDIIQALNKCGELFTQFGGHAQAAGFMIPTEKLPLLVESLMETATTQLEAVDLRPRIDIDAEVSFSDLAGNTYWVMQELAPFGQGNPLPVFLTRNVNIIDYRKMGKNGKHLRLRLAHDGKVWDAVAFGFGQYLPEYTKAIDIVYNLELNQWNGEENLRFTVLDLALPGSEDPAFSG